MKLENLPDFAKPYKTKGHDVRLVGKSYQLFKITSVRVPNKPHPVLKQEYLGVIDPDKGLLPKRHLSEEKEELLEYGLSSFILKRYKRTLKRAVFTGCTDDVIYLSIIYFMYGHVEDRFIKLSYLSTRLEPLSDLFRQVPFMKKVVSMAKRIEQELRTTFTEGSDCDYLIALLKEIKINPKAAKTKTVKYPTEAIELFNKYQIKYE